MKCPTIDKLEQWFDGFDQVDEIIQSHVETCQECQQVIKMYAEEQELIKETLRHQHYLMILPFKF